MTTYGPSYVTSIPTATGTGEALEPSSAITGPPDDAGSEGSVGSGSTSLVYLCDHGLGSAVLNKLKGAVATVWAYIENAAFIGVQFYVEGVAVGDELIQQVEDTSGGFAAISFGGVGNNWNATLAGVNVSDVRMGVRVFAGNEGGGIYAVIDAAQLTLTDTTSKRGAIRNRPKFGTLRRGMGRRLWGRC